MQEDIANDPNIKEAYTALENRAKELFPDGNVNWQDSRLSDLIKNLQSVRRKAMIKYYALYAKSGTKLTYSDNTDKYLYRTNFSSKKEKILVGRCCPFYNIQTTRSWWRISNKYSNFRFWK